MVRKRNMVFRKDGRILPHLFPRLHLADTIEISYEYQKRDERNNTVTQWRTGDSTYCPVVVSAAVVRRLEAMGASESDFIYKCGSAPTAAVVTDTARCKGPYSQLIDCFAVFPRGSGLGLRSQRT